MDLPPAPPPLDRRTMAEEVLVVLILSLLASAVYALLDLFAAPLKGVTVFSVDQSNELLRQLVGVFFGLGPVYLVLHLARRDEGGVASIGLAPDRFGQQVARGVVLFAIVGAVGIGVYLAAVALGVNRFVVPAPPLGHWWTVPLLLLNAAQAALLEETIVLGYLITRLRQLGWAPTTAIVASAVLRGSYHLYQGWGGFAGNLAMGLLFGWIFVRTRRAWPFVVAHFLLDVGAGLGYVFFRNHLPGFH
jgi:membrane protease YdiL (CAAX protease family)